MDHLHLFVFTLVYGITIANNCMPTNWSYAWMKVGNTWFTRMDTPRTWVEQMKICKSIDPSLHSSIASIRTKEEHTKVMLRFPGNLYTGGFEIGSTGQWFWWRSGNEPDKITTTFWRHNEPNQHKGRNEACILYSIYKGWDDVPCSSKFKALCEVRCT